jgi:hypothetical protein
MKYFVLMLFLVACHKPVNLAELEKAYDAYMENLPALKVVPTDKPIIIKINYVENSALPGLSGADRERLYRRVETITNTALHYQLQIREVQKSDLASYLDKVKSRFAAKPISFPAQAYLISFFAKNRDAEIEKAIAATLARHKPAKIAEYLGTVPDSKSARAIFLDKLSAIFGEPDLAGHPLLSEANKTSEVTFSYGHWSTILQGESEADFILTNVGIIGADTGMPLYVIARGGVTSAFVENNAMSPFQGTGVIGLYPFLADTPYFNKVRGVLDLNQKIESIAWLWVHELGHLLMKKEENYTLPASVHRAPPDLRYYEWAKSVSASNNHQSDQVPQLKKF